MGMNETYLFFSTTKSRMFFYFSKGYFGVKNHWHLKWLISITVLETHTLSLEHIN